MKKKMKWIRVLCGVVMLLVMMGSLTVPMASADDDSYVLLGHRFSQGIGNVTCKNSVSVDDYPELYVAVADAIRDWDWHLGLLNDRYNVNWNMTDVTGTQSSAMIECVTMSNDESIAFLMESMSRNEAVLISSAKAYVKYFANGVVVDPAVQNWDSCKMVFLWENLDAVGKLNDYYYLKKVVNHELGHTLGLGECYEDTGVVMYPNREVGTADVATEADLAGVYAIYG